MTYTRGDAIAEERAQNQTARERQEQARQEQKPESQPENKQDSDKAARIAERLKKYHEAQEANQDDHFLKLNCHSLGRFDRRLLVDLPKLVDMSLSRL